MDRKSIVQEYYILATDENGNMAAMNKEECEAGMVAASLMDLLLNYVVKIEKKKITVIKDLPDKLCHITSLYEYLKEKPRSTNKLMDDYITSTKRRIKQLIADTGESLLAEHFAEKGKGGLFGNKTMYIPKSSCKEELAGLIKAAARAEIISPHDMALLCILQETKNLKPYFSGQERDEWKARWKELKKNPQSRQLAEMIHYISDMTAIMTACVLTSSM